MNAYEREKKRTEREETVRELVFALVLLLVLVAYSCDR